MEILKVNDLKKTYTSRLGGAQVQASGAFAQPHDLGAEQELSPQQEAQPDERIATPAETMPAANMFKAEFFMPPL